ncbi:hypothetical protein SAMD00019534_001570 [Acytostelium subglobosum LB1]|uniref:hypothetical protein n=1 Tax=Acytostelium subglobosum LB1 TaxID=1410327 RepID=UPI000644DE0B|nr:hypothetical protein SAMD00019534_001570 [Acytostelium subglobosum LB1]GAM16982.1 hypothetical protein SAMD00019534_001570 [Acytostelium subglobosum LB1]|eukprot:XP_012759044.1 hypothetical protein SAMD00019534_001570 [Acytostelium subglobosum LB1]
MRPDERNEPWLPPAFENQGNFRNDHLIPISCDHLALNMLLKIKSGGDQSLLWVDRRKSSSTGCACKSSSTLFHRLLDVTIQLKLHRLQVDVDIEKILLECQECLYQVFVVLYSTERVMTGNDVRDQLQKGVLSKHWLSYLFNERYVSSGQ